MWLLAVRLACLGSCSRWVLGWIKRMSEGAGRLVTLLRRISITGATHMNTACDGHNAQHPVHTGLPVTASQGSSHNTSTG